MTRNELDQALAQAHENGDLSVISMLYHEAGDGFEREGHIDEACFYWTQAYVFALEAGADEAGSLRAKLRQFGREA